MKYYALPALLLALLLLATPVLAEDAGTTGDTSDEETTIEQKPKPGPGPLERAKEARENLQERHDLMLENKGERKNLFQENKQERIDFRQGSGTPKERFELFRENALERRALFIENKGERRDLLQQQWEERKAHFASSTDMWKSRFASSTKERIAKRADHVANLLDAMLVRLHGISDRIAARIEEQKDAGEDVAGAEAALAEADTELGEAEDAIDAVKDAMQSALASETPRDEVKETVKPLMETAKEALREAHKALMNAAQELARPQKQEGEEPVE